MFMKLEDHNVYQFRSIEFGLGFSKIVQESKILKNFPNRAKMKNLSLNGSILLNVCLKQCMNPSLNGFILLQVFYIFINDSLYN